MSTDLNEPVTTSVRPAAPESHGTGPSKRGANPDQGGPGTYIALGIGLILMVIPFLWMAVSAIKPESEIRSRSADLVAGDRHLGQLPTSSSPGWTSRRTS